MFREFKEFAMKGNVVDLAVGVIMALAFGKIVSSLVEDILMPPLALFTKGVDFTNYFVTLSGGSFATLQEAKAAGAATVNYGIFLKHTVDFILVAFAVFLLVKQINRMRRTEPPPPPPASKPCTFCHTAIPLEAVRCPNCTSHLEQSAGKASPA